MPSLPHGVRAAPTADPGTRILQLKDVQKAFGRRDNQLIFRGVSLSVRAGETLGISGESGIGKTTLGRVIAGLERPASGKILYRGRDIHHLPRREFWRFRRKVQMIFQDPEGSFNPTKTLRHSLADVLRLIRVPPGRREARMGRSLREVGLSPEVLDRFPRQLSGGMNQRAALARVLLLEPELIVLDEPTSALDLTLRNQILHLLQRMKGEKHLGYVLISHDRRVIDFMSDRKGRLENRQFILEGPAEQPGESP